MDQSLVAVKEGQSVSLAHEPLRVWRLVVWILREPDTFHVLIVTGESREECRASEAQARVLLAMLNSRMQRSWAVFSSVNRIRSF